MVVSAHAVNFYWDGTGTGWDANSSWSTVQTASTPDPALGAVPGASDLAIFVATTATSAQTVNLNGAQSALGLATNASNTFLTTLQGGGTNQVLSLGTSGISHLGGVLTIGSATTGQQVAISLQGSQDWTSSSTGTNLGPILIMNGVSIGAGGNQTLTLRGTNATSTVSGAISDGAATLSVTKADAGTWTLSNPTNTYTGATTISGGTLKLSNNTTIGNNIASSSGILIGNGATLDTGGLSSTISAAGIVLASGQSITGTGTTGSIVNNNVAVSAVTLNGNNTLSNNAGGTLTTARINVLNNNGSTNAITAGNIVSSVTSGRGLIIGNGPAGTLTISGGSLTTSSTQTAGNGDLLGNGSGTGTLIINGGSYTNTAAAGLAFGIGGTTPGAGVLTLTNGSATIATLVFNASTVGGATVNLDGGTLTLASMNNLGGKRTINFNGGLLKASGNLTIASTSLNSDIVNVKNGGAIIDTQTNAVTISSKLTHFTGATTDTLTKLGSGSLTLSNAANTYAGATTVKAGSLIVSGSISGSTLTTVGDALNLGTSAVLTGAGTVGALTVGAAAANTGAAVDPGNGAASVSGGSVVGNNVAGVLTTQAFTLSSGTHLAIQLGGTTAGTSYDQISATSLSLAGDLQVSLINSFNPPSGLFFVAVQSGNASQGTFGAFSNASEGSTINLGGQDYQITYGANWTGSDTTSTFTGGNDVALMVVPEPGSLVSLLGGLGMLAALRRFRRHGSAHAQERE